MPKRRAAKENALSKAPTHLDAQGHARVVDVGDKPVTSRIAKARSVVRTTREVVAAIRNGNVPKGDVAAVARIAALMGAKRTSDLIPLCHPLSLSRIRADVVMDDATIWLEVEVGCNGRTGVEMEALTGASVGALAIYDMIKSMDRGATIGPIELLEKTGGKSGHWKRTP